MKRNYFCEVTNLLYCIRRFFKGVGWRLEIRKQERPQSPLMNCNVSPLEYFIQLLFAKSRSIIAGKYYSGRPACRPVGWMEKLEIGNRTSTAQLELELGLSLAIMVFYIGKQAENELQLDFVFSIGHLNNDNGVIPRNELDVIERGTRQCERLLEWMTPTIKRKIMITDAKVPLLWLKNKDLRTKPYVQTRVHSICKQFKTDEMYYIKSKLNPADLGTKLDQISI